MGKQSRDSSKITADGDCSPEIKRCLFLGRKAMINLDHILKSRDIVLLTKIRLVRAMVCPVVMYECESWTIKKAEHQRIELWFWGRFLRVPWLQGDQNSQSSRKSVLNVHWKGWCWGWSSNTLVTWYEELTPWKSPLYWERLKAEGEGDGRGWDGWVASLTRWMWVWVDSRSWWWTGRPGVLQFTGLQRAGHDRATELNWMCKEAYF